MCVALVIIDIQLIGRSCGSVSIVSFLLFSIVFSCSLLFNVFFIIPFIMLSYIFSLELPFYVFPNICPIITSFTKPLPLGMCPIQFFCLFKIIFMSHLFSATPFSSSSFDTQSIPQIFSILLQIHITNASSLLISSFFNIHILHHVIPCSMPSLLQSFCCKLKLL